MTFGDEEVFWADHEQVLWVRVAIYLLSFFLFALSARPKTLKMRVRASLGVRNDSPIPSVNYILLFALL